MKSVSYHTAGAMIKYDCLPTTVPKAPLGSAIQEVPTLVLFFATPCGPVSNLEDMVKSASPLAI